MDTPENKHSGLGLASFIISGASGVAIFLVIAIAGMMEASTPGGMDENSLAANLVGLLFIASLFASLSALGLGLAGVFQKGRKKIFAVLGTVFSTATVVGTAVLMLAD